MKHTREFEIAWQGLKPGLQQFAYEIDDKFMQEKGGDPLCSNWNAKVTLGFDKHESFFILNFDVNGGVTVQCDRCGDDFELRLWDEFKLVVKLVGEDAAELEDEDDVVFISRGETVIDISDWLYEFLMLSLPLQRIHPDGADGESGCNKKALSLLESMNEIPTAETQQIWKGLERLAKPDEKLPEIG